MIEKLEAKQYFYIFSSFVRKFVQYISQESQGIRQWIIN